MDEKHAAYTSSPWGHIQLTAIAVGVQFDSERMHVRLIDGRVISVPLTWFPRLLHATPEQRNRWELIISGKGLRWEEIDEDISIKGLLCSCE
ncbi:MAG: DUF2442 domain-containing protein [Ktedonobacteraceae bacterium]|nr:DUF2442 domain-containing protein [Ktedonobacteraceae bacterium]